MKITEIVCQIIRIPQVMAKTASSQDSVIVRVRADNGLEGVGEADSSPEVVKAIIDAPFSHNIACGLRQVLLGENPLEQERLWQKMYRRTMYFGRTGAGITAMAAVDMALWDLKGKALGQPIHRLLGGKHHSKLRGYASILFGRDGKETADIARRWVTGERVDWASLSDVSGHPARLSGLPTYPFERRFCGADDATIVLLKNGVLVLSSITGGDRRLEVPADRINLDFVLGNKVMVGTVNASRENFETGVRDMSQAEAEYPGWLARLLTHPVKGLERYEELFTLLNNPSGAIKIYCEVA